MISFNRSVASVLNNRNLLAVTITFSMSQFAAFLWRPYWGLYILELGGSKSTIGILTTLQSLVTLLALLPGGILSDRYGRKRVILAASIFEFLPPLIFLFSAEWTMLIPGVVAYALSSLYAPALSALLADSLPEDKRATGFGIYTMAYYLCIVVSYPLGGYILDTVGTVQGTHVGIILSLLLTVPIFLIRWRFIEETVKPEPEGISIDKRFMSLSRLRGLPSSIWKLIIVAILSSFGFQMFWTFVVVYSVEVKGLTMMQWSYGSVVANLAAALFMIPSGLLSDRAGRKRIIMLSQSVVSLSSLGFIFSPGFSGIVVTRLLGGIGEGLGGNVMSTVGGPIWQALVTEIAPIETRGSILGLMGTLTGFLTTPAPIVGGYLYENMSPQTPFLVSTFVGLIGCVLFSLWLKEPKR